MNIFAKDFLETRDGLIFAVVESGFENDKILCFLRYIKVNRQWNKLNTKQANLFLSEHYPHYLYYSPFKQAHCHALTLAQIFKHHQPRLQLAKLLNKKNTDKIEQDLIELCCLYERFGVDLAQIGVTGSILISAQSQNSDIDLVCYSRTQFNQLRTITGQLIQQGDCSELNESDWLESYKRRACDLSYGDYCWHEKRKLNKAVINQRKFDLNLVLEAHQNLEIKQYEKQGTVVLKLQVTDDISAFDYPAEFKVKHHSITSIISYTATYTGQAKVGEWVDVSGALEQSEDGVQRIIVGSSREATGEYIKVIRG